MKRDMSLQLSSAGLKKLQSNRTWFMGLGISLVILGALAVMFAYVSTIFSMVYLGLIFAVVGIAEIIKAIKVRSSFGMFLVQLFFGILYIVAGVYIVSYPVINAVTLTLLFALLFIVIGIARVVAAFFGNAPHRGWLLFNGIITILLGALIWQQWPSSGLWVIGLFVGINAIFTGLSWIMLASKLKRIKA